MAYKSRKPVMMFITGEPSVVSRVYYEWETLLK